MIDHKLLKAARDAAATEGIQKEAFNPMTPEAQAAAAQQGAAPMDPAMAGGAPPMDPAMMGGAPPMDPAMMGGAPPMDPAMMGMDPAMAGGAPPMDPAMMGMDPAMMGMDPAMMGMDPMAGGAPMEDPAAAGTPVTLTLEDLRQVIKELDGEGPEDADKPKRATNRQIMDELSSLKEAIAALAAASGVQLPAGDVGTEGDTSASPASSSPEEIAAVAAEMGGMPGEPAMDPAMAGMDPMSQALDMGLPPGEMPPEAMPKMAVDKFLNTRLGQKTK